jgi:hypothetical protein
VIAEADDRRAVIMVVARPAAVAFGRVALTLRPLLAIAAGFVMAMLGVTGFCVARLTGLCSMRGRMVIVRGFVRRGGGGLGGVIAMAVLTPGAILTRAAIAAAATRTLMAFALGVAAAGAGE